MIKAIIKKDGHQFHNSSNIYINRYSNNKKSMDLQINKYKNNHKIILKKTILVSSKQTKILTGRIIILILIKRVLKQLSQKLSFKILRDSKIDLMMRTYSQ